MACLFGLALGAPLPAATYTVTSAADDGSAGTLRWAIAQANSDAGSTIALNDNLGTITLTSALQIITTGMTINGGAGNTISGNGLYRVFFVNTVNSSDAVKINNVTIADGFAKGGDGGVSAGGGLGAGGAIFVSKGAVTVAGLTLSGNTAQGGHGGDGVVMNSSVSAGGGGGLGGNGGNGGRFGAGGGGGYGGNGGTGDQNSSGGGGGIVGNGGNGSGFTGGGGGGTTNGGTPAGGTGGGKGAQSGVGDPNPTGGSTGGGGGGGTYDPAFTVNSGANGGVYGGGGGASAGMDANSGRGGNGGDFGGGGGINGDGGGAGGGSGGYGGGGGGGGAFYDPAASSSSPGANGGFGGGGGGGITRNGNSAGYGGSGGSYLPRFFTSIPGAGGGGGGAALGGAIFVRSDNGASLTFAGGSEGGSGVTAGLAGASLAGNPNAILREAQNGQAVGGAIFLPAGESVFQAGTFSGEISGVPGAVLRKTTPGTVTLNGGGSGDLGLTLEAGTLALGHAGALGSRGTITFTGGTLQFSGANAVDYSARFSTADNQPFNFDTNGQNVRLGASLVSAGGSLTKTGAGTLTLGGAMNYSGLTTIAAGTLRLETSGAGSDSGKFRLTGSGTALDLNGTTQRPILLSGVAGSAVTLGGGSLTVGGDNASTTFAGNISDAGGNSARTGGTLTKVGTGTLTLTGDNSFTGATTVSAGALQLGNGGTTGSLAGPIVDNAVFVFNRSDDVTLAAGISGTGNVIKMGAGRLALGGVNSYTGTTDVQAGALYSSGSLASSSVNLATGTSFTATGTGTISGNIVGAGAFNRVGSGLTILTGAASQTGGTSIDGGTLQVGNGGTTGSISGAITNNGTLSFNRGDFLAVAGSISGSGTVRQDGPGTTELTGSNSYGHTVITAGTLSIGSDTALGAGPITITGGGIRAGGAARNLANDLALDGSFTLGRLTNFSGPAVLGADLTITSANPDPSGPTSSTFSGVISGAHRLTFDAGANPIGAIVLSGSNTYTGGTTLTAGTLLLGPSAALGTGGLAVNGGTLDLGGNGISVAGLSGSGGVITNGAAGAATLTTDQAASTTYAGVLQNGSGTVALTKTGPGTLTLLGGNTYTGATTITAGTLQIGNGGTAGLISGASVVNRGSLAFNRSDAVAYGGVISGSGGLVQLGQGTLALTGNNTYTGDTTLAAGTLSLGRAGALGTGGRINFTGGALQFTSSNTTDYSARFSGAAGQAYRLDTNGQTVTLASGLDSAGGSLTKLGLGTLILAGGNAYDGGTVIEAGTLQFTNTPAIGNLTLDGGTLDLGGRSLTVTALRGGSGALITNGTAGAAILTANQAAATTYAGALEDGAGTLTFRKTGPGTLTLSGSNSYTGGTILEGGALNLGSANAIGTSGPISFLGGTLQFSSSNTADTSARFSNADGQAYRLDTNGQAVTLASRLGSAGGSLTKLGAGTLTLTGNNTNTGGTVIAQGTLQVGRGGTAGALGSGDIANAGLLAFDRSDETTVAGAISGAGALEQRGSGNLILTGNNTYTGDTRVLQGSVQIGDGGTTGSITSNVLSDANVAFNRRDDVTYAGAVSGLGTLEQRGAGTLTLTGANTNSGGALITAGTLQIGAGDTTGSLVGSIANNGLLAFNRRDTITFAGGISGTGGLEQRGAGTLILTGSNSFSGQTTIAQGTLQIGAGGTGGSILGNVTNNGALVFNSSLNQDFAGVISGSGSVTKTGSNTLSLSGTNTYAGGTNIQAGTLAIADPTALGAAGSLITFGAQSTIGTLKALASLNLAQTLVADRSRGGRIDTNGFDVSIAAISGAGTFSKLGAGQLTLTGTSAFSGGLSSATAVRIAPGATFRQINDPTFVTVGNLATDLIVDGALVFDRSTARAFGNTLSGTGTVTQLRSTLTLTGSNELFTGNVILQGGTLEVGSDTALGSGGLTLAGGSIRAVGTGRTITNPLTVTGDFGLGRYTDLTSDIVLSANRAIIMNNPDGGGGDSFLRGTISGPGSLTVSAGGNAGALGLSGTNTYTGDTIVANGATLAIGRQANLGASSGTLVFQNGTLRLDGDFGLNDRAIRLDGNFTLDSNGRDTTLSLANALGDGSFTKAGGGTLTLTGAATYTGGTAINGGAVVFTDAANLGTGGISVNGGALRFGANNAADISSRLTVSSGVIDTNGNDLDFASAIGGTNYTLQKAGAGTLNLAGGTASMTRLTVNAGTVRLSNDGSILNAYTTVADGAALEINRSDTVSLIRGVQATSGATLRFMGTGTTTLSLSSNLNFISGANVLVDAGRLVLNAQNSASATRFASDITNNGVVEMSYSGTSTFANVISGTGSFVKSGIVVGGFPAYLTLSGANTYTGPTTIQTGTLSLGSTGSLASSRIQVNGGATFAVNPAGTTILTSQTLSGSGTVTGPITIAGTISPGNSPGTLTTAAETWDGGGTYVWELNSATGTAGTNWDFLNIGGTLTINSSPANPFVIDVRSLGFDNLAGAAANFVPGADYTWKIATASGGISGFGADKFVIGTSAFSNDPASAGAFAVIQSQDGLSLSLTYTAVPEPGAWGAILGAALLGMAFLRRWNPSKQA